MTNYIVRLECAAERDEPNDVAEDFDAIAEAFFDLENVHDHDLAADLTARTLTFSVSVAADDEFRALDIALGSVRTALHAAGRGTPGWERHYRMLRQEIEEETLPAD